MSTKTKPKPKAKSNAKGKAKNTKDIRITPRIVWFEIPANNPERAKKFYGKLFGWKIELFPGMTDYWHIDMGGGDAHAVRSGISPRAADGRGRGA